MPDSPVLYGLYNRSVDIDRFPAQFVHTMTNLCGRPGQTAERVDLKP